jgi:hypothetical protein
MKDDVTTKINMKPFEELTPDQKEFIGTTFPTPKGGVLTVVGVDKVKRGSNARFILECSICSQDKELFPERFLSEKGNLIEGKVPCGCGASVRWDETQYIIKIKRECEKRGYEFKGWVSNFKGVYTKLKLYNPVTENEWYTTNIDKFLNDGNGDPVEGREKTVEGSLKGDDVHIEAFMKTGVFLKGTIFTRNKERVDSRGSYSYWDVTCPECSNDVYFQNKLCNGVFTSYVGTLKLGQQPCRCGKSFRWTKEQRKFKIKNTLEKECSTWDGWVNLEVGYENAKSKFKWICQKGHFCNTSVNNFISGKRCKTCAMLESSCYGYYKDKTQEKDFLYVYIFKGLPYIKVGRTFEPDRRLKENQQRVNKYYHNKKHKISTVRLYSSTHEIIYNLEQYLVNKDTSRLFKGTFDESLHMVLEDGYGSSELLKKEGLEKVIDFLDGFVYSEKEFMGSSFKLDNELENK